MSFRSILLSSLLVFLRAALLSSTDLRSPEAITELKEAIVNGLGFQSEDVEMLGFDGRDALVGHAVAYEFDVEIGKRVVPLKFLEDVEGWEYVDVPIFRYEDGLVAEHRRRQRPVLAPFQLAGPMEIWIQDANDMRISLPRDVDAGVLKKVVLADGAVVTVRGARSVSLRRPLDLPLPLTRRGDDEVASGLLRMAEHLRRTNDSSSPLLSLLIVGPTSLTPPHSVKKLRLRKLAPGLVELSSLAEAPSDPDGFTSFWPLVSVNGSNRNLVGFERLLSSMLMSGKKKKGPFRLLRADVSAETHVKIVLGVEKRVTASDGLWERLPAWRTKPHSVRLHFEVLAKVHDDGDRIVPHRILQLHPVLIQDSFSPDALLGNATLKTL